MIKQLTLVSLIFGLIIVTLTTAQAKKKSLFDGKSFSGWVTKDGEPVTKGWIIEDGAMYRKSQGGDIYTVDDYENFILEFEWKVVKACNSGVKYRMKKIGKKMLGPEYQVLDDDGHANGSEPLKTAASMYELYPAPADKVIKPLGEYNHSKIVAKGNHIEHWLNGTKVVSAEIGSDEWFERLANSKFKGNEGYGVGAGKIMLQDHHDPVWFRNIKIKVLK